MSTSLFNRRWATLLLEALTRHGVRHICIAPGSRSTPLTLSAASNPRFICHTHFDERGLGHLALGLAKASLEAVAVIVTSGTAVANLYPALIEAGLAGERLVMLTADRPPELIDCGANQAIRQPGIFANHPLKTLNLPRPTPEIPARWLVSALDSALAQLSYGALHINVPFAEPLYGETPDRIRDSWSESLGNWWQTEVPWLQESGGGCAVRVQADWPRWRQKRGVILAGRMQAREGRLLALWAQRLGWPLIGDLLSQTGQPLACAELWLGHPQAQNVLKEAQIVVQFGSSLTGQRLLQWQRDCDPQEYWLIDPLPGRRDPAHHAGRRLVASIEDWLVQHPASPEKPWAEELVLLAHKAQQCVTTYLAFQFGEAQVAHRLAQLLPENGQVFVGNSLIIRLIDAFAQLPAGYPLYSNRGASGIDGLIATLAGVQRGSGRPTLAILGDLSALYDLNALALLRHNQGPTVLIVVNNNGGQIFSLLPTPETERELFYVMPQNVEFRYAAAMFHLAYEQPENWQELVKAVQQGWRRAGTTLIELKVVAQEGADSLRVLSQQVAAL